MLSIFYILSEKNHFFKGRWSPPLIEDMSLVFLTPSLSGLIWLEGKLWPFNLCSCTTRKWKTWVIKSPDKAIIIWMGDHKIWHLTTYIIPFQTNYLQIFYEQFLNLFFNSFLKIPLEVMMLTKSNFKWS